MTSPNSMTRPATRVAAVILALCLAVTAFAAKPPKRPVDTLKFPPLNPIHEPAIEQVTLPNGMELFLVRDTELPLIQMKALVRGGKVAAAVKPALPDLFDEVFRTGGTASMTGDKVDEYLEGIGASIECGISDAYSSISAKMLKESLDKVLPLYAEFLMNPGFEEAKLDLAKTQIKSVIARRNDEPMNIGRREFLKKVYGTKSPYALQVEYDDLDTVSREDLVGFHRAFFRPDNTILAVWGDFDPAAMKREIESAFGAWKGVGPHFPVKPYPYPEPAASVNYAERAGAEQTIVLMGHEGLRLDDPNYPAIYILSEILGGGFSSRIFTQVRTIKGLAYGAGGFMVPAYDRNGAFYFYTSTKPSTTSEAIQTMLDEIRKIRESPVTDDELDRAKQAYLNGYAFEFDSVDKIINRRMTYLLYGYPADFNVKLRASIEKVTKEDVLSVAKRYLWPDKLHMVAVGDAKNFDKPLSTFGTVNTLDISIPEPKPKEVIPEATPETLKAGTASLLKAVKATGETGLKSLKDISFKGEMTMKTPMGEMAMQVKGISVPMEKSWNELQTPMGKMLQVLSGDAAWMVMGTQTQNLPASAADEMKKGTATDAGCLYLLQQALLGKLQGQLIGKATFEGAEADDVLIKLGAFTYRLYIGTDGKVLGTKGRAMTQEGPVESVEIYSDWRDAGGMKIPFSSVSKQNGEVAQTSKMTTIKLNASYDAKLFEKPAAAPAK